MLRNVIVCAALWYCGNAQVIPSKSRTADGEYNSVNTDGSFDFGYANQDRGQSYHLARGNAAKVVGGRFGARDPATGTVKETVYTAGPRGFRAKGPNIHRKMDLDQRPRGPIGNRDDPYFDPSEDPSYAFQFKTQTYSKTENADGRGDVKGHYSFVDDVGEQHDVTYIAGRDTGFHVSSAYPDSPSKLTPLFYNGPLVRGESRQRGRSSVQRGLDGSYRFISAGPDQRRTESSDAHGNVRGSYTFLDDKGVQRSVHYIAGPGIGYRIVKNNKDPYIPSYFPTIPSAYDPDFAVAAEADTTIPADEKYSDGESVDDIFKGPDGTSASGHVKPPPFSTGNGDKGDKKPGSGGNNVGAGFESDGDEDIYGSTINEKPRPILGNKPGSRPFKPGRPTNKPYVPLKPFRPSPSPSGPSLNSNEAGVDEQGPSAGGYGSDDGAYRPDKDGYGSDGAYRPDKDDYGPDKGDYNPNSDGYRPGKGDGYRPDANGYKPGKGGGKPNKGGSYKPDVGSAKPSKGDGNRPGQGGYRPGDDGGYKPNKEGDYRPDKGGAYDSDKGNAEKEDAGAGPEFGVGFNVDHTQPGSTIIRNIGEDYFAVPPGVAVRAHVQSIDLYPFGSKRLSPGEAIDKVKT